MTNLTEQEMLEQLEYRDVSYQNQDAHAKYYDAVYDDRKVELKIVKEHQHENDKRELWERDANLEDWYYVEDFE